MDDDKDVTLKRSQIKTLIDQARAGDEEEICPTAKSYIKKLDKDFDDDDDEQETEDYEYEKDDEQHRRRKQKKIKENYRDTDERYEFKLPKLPNLGRGLKKFFG